MAGSPYTGLPDTQAPSTSPSVFQTPQSIPSPIGAFGGQTAEAVQGLGKPLMDASDLFGKVAADDAANKYQEGVNRILYGDPQAKGPDGQPDTGYMGLKGDAALRARPDVDKRIESLRTELKGGLKTLKSDVDFDNISRRYKAITDAQIGNHARTQANVYAASVNTATAKLKLDDIARDWEDPVKAAHAEADLIGAYVKNAELAGGGPELIKEAYSRARRDALTTRMDMAAVHNPAMAMRMLEANKGIVGAQYDNLAGKYRARADVQEGQEYADRILGRSGVGPNENNIGNVRPVGGGANSGFVKVDSFDQGVALTVDNARAYPKAFNGGKPMTLEQIGERWAPKGDGANDPGQWAKNVASGSGLPLGKPVDLNHPETAARFARGVHTAEWGGGKVKPLQDYLPGASGKAAPTAAPSGRPSVRNQAELMEEVLRDPDLQNRPHAQAAALQRINQSYTAYNTQQAKTEAAFKQQVDDSRAEALNTGGTAAPISREQFIAHYGDVKGPVEYDNYASDVTFGADFKSMQSMSDAEQTQFLNARLPQPGAPGYAHAIKNQDRLRKGVDDIQKQRRDDPSGAVSRMPAVMDAYKTYDPKKPETFKAVADARLVAQERLGIEPEFRSPITKAEALHLTTPLRTMLPGDENRVLKDMGLTFQKMFGDQADEAFAYAIRAHKVDAEVAQQAASIVRKLREGVPLVPRDAAAMDSAKETSAASRAVNGHAPRAAPRVVDNPESNTGFEGSPVIQPRNVPPAAIEFLLKNPDTADAFDKKYGSGRAKQIREKYPVAPGLP